jgi:cytochrome bd-type quinol oxidase subunit 2
MKKNSLLASFLICISIVSLALVVNMNIENVTFAQFDENYIDDIQSHTELPTFDTNVHADAIAKPGVSNITSALYFAIDFAKYLIGSIAIITLLITGIRMIFARKQIDDVWSKQKDKMIFMAVAFGVIMIADVAVKQTFFGTHGEVLDTVSSAQDAAIKGSEQIRGVVSMILMFVGTLAVLMLVTAGIRLLTSAGNEESQTKVKKQITWVVLGLFILGIAEFVILDIVFPDKGSRIPDLEQGKQLIKNFTNFVSAFVSIAAVLSSIYGGYLYVAAAGNEEQTEKAKKVLTGALIAIVLGLGAFAIVNTVIQLEPGV